MEKFKRETIIYDSVVIFRSKIYKNQKKMFLCFVYCLVQKLLFMQFEISFSIFKFSINNNIFNYIYIYFLINKIRDR